ncbi:hypothetical protein U9M48_038430 [Paspalum notatum var. saurae]|uniref:Integrase catalytic domain-containing protein n=1 Tax=Paspalum notatum var. saurae TaxID=547442 RepID=A0AAQ3ULU2_PASNO
MGLTPPASAEWIADSGASFHTTLDAGILFSVRPPNPSCPSSIMVGDGSCLPVTSMGSAYGSFHLPNVLVAPNMVHNLLSIRQFTADNSYSVEFDSSDLTVKDLASRRLLLRCESTGPLYTLRLPTSAASPLTSSPSAAFTATTSTTWHRRLGHPGRDILAQLSRSADVPCTRTPDKHLCHITFLILYTVICGPLMYYLVVVDDFSHYSWTFSLRSKSETFSTLSHFFAWVSTQFGLTIKAVQCDNGHEFDSNAFRSFFLSRGVQLRMSCPYTFPQNGKAERMIRTTNDVIRTLLFQASLLARFWAESLHTATYLLNRLPSTASPAPTPHHALFGTPPRYDHLVSSGVRVTPTPPPVLPTSWRPIQLGYRCLDLTSRRILISRHVVFYESDFPFSTTSTPASDHELETVFPTDPVVQPPLSTCLAGSPPAVLPDPSAVPRAALEFPVARAAPTPPSAPCAAPVAPSPAPPARYAQLVRVYQRRLVPPPAPAPPSPSSSPASPTPTPPPAPPA